MTHTCQMCTGTFIAPPQAKYCEGCRPLAKRVRETRYYRERMAKNQRYCQRCGGEVEGRSLYCPPCKAVARREATRRYQEGKRLDGWAEAKGGFVPKEECYVQLIKSMVRVCYRDIPCYECLIEGYCNRRH